MTYIEPLLTLFVAICFIGWFCRGKAGGSNLLILGLAGLLLLCWPADDWLLSRPLEIWYPVEPFHAAPTQAIVVFSSGAEPGLRDRPYPLPDDETYRRCEYAA
jgi:hypothetical protein